LEVGPVFGRGKLPPKTHAQHMRDELAESYGHLKLAATHVAGGAAEKLTPTYDRTRRLAARGWNSTRGGLAPVLHQMKDGAENARRKLKPESTLKMSVKSKKSRRTKPALVGLLAAGAVAGAAGAMITRRRRAARQWDEYQPGHTGSGTGSMTSNISRAAKDAKDKVAAGAATAADRVSDTAAMVSDRLHERAGDIGSEATLATDRTASTFSQFADEADEFSARANASRNGRP
jgi:gas vesicle protein